MQVTVKQRFNLEAPEFRPPFSLNPEATVFLPRNWFNPEVRPFFPPFHFNKNSKEFVPKSLEIQRLSTLDPNAPEFTPGGKLFEVFSSTHEDWPKIKFAPIYAIIGVVPKVF